MNKEGIKEGISHLEMLLNYGILSSEDEPHIKTVLNYIEKLEKENEKMSDILSKEIKTHVDMNMVELFLEAKNKPKPKPKTKIGEISGVEVYITPSQKNEHIKTLIETEYISKDKIRDKIEELKEDRKNISEAIEYAKENKDKDFLKYNRETLYRVNGEISVLEELLEEEK